MAIKSRLILEVSTWGDGVSTDFIVDITKGPVSFSVPGGIGNQMAPGFSFAAFLPTDVQNMNNINPNGPTVRGSISPLGILTIIFSSPPLQGQKDDISMDIIF